MIYYLEIEQKKRKNEKKFKEQRTDLLMRRVSMMTSLVETCETRSDGRVYFKPR